MAGLSAGMCQNKTCPSRFLAPLARPGSEPDPLLGSLGRPPSRPSRWILGGAERGDVSRQGLTLVLLLVKLLQREFSAPGDALTRIGSQLFREK